MDHYYRFARFEVRPLERSLYAGGKLVSIGARAFDVLLALIDRRDRIVTKSELLELVWPGLFVEENNLQVQVSALRKTLEPQIVLTVPGKGYRFVAAIEKISTLELGTGESTAQSSSSITPYTVIPLKSRHVIGRERELEELIHLVKDYPLVSVIGASGIGKTALMCAAVHSQNLTRTDGIVWLDLSRLTDTSQILTAMLESMNLAMCPEQDLMKELKKLDLLLVLDNAEHLRHEVAELAWTIGGMAPGVHMLITSQVALKIEGERILRLGGLAIPNQGADAHEAVEYGAVKLFLDQAKASDNRFALTADNVETIISLCWQVDGMPLALKLAAARLPLLGLEGVESRLDKHLEILNGVYCGSGGERQRSLNASLEASYLLLSEIEKNVFRRCSVFVGGFNLEQILVLCSDEQMDDWTVINALEGLVDRSLIDVDSQHSLHYRIPKYAYAYSQLKLDNAQETELIREMHANAYADLMDLAYNEYWQCGDQVWLERYGSEVKNVRSAIHWSIHQGAELSVRLVGASAPLFFLLGLTEESLNYFTDCEPIALAASVPSRLFNSTYQLARYWLEQGRLNHGFSHTLVYEYAQNAEVYFRMIDDHQGVYLALGQSIISGHQGQEAPLWLDEMMLIEKASWPPRLMSECLLAKIISLQASGQRFEERFALESLQLMASSAGLHSVEITALCGLVKHALQAGKYDEALCRSQELMSLPHQTSCSYIHALASLSIANLFKDNIDESRTALIKFVDVSRNAHWQWFDYYADLFALQAALENRTGAAARLLGYAVNAVNSMGAFDHCLMRVRAEANRVLKSSLDEALKEQLMQEGGRMHRDAVCTLVHRKLEGSPFYEAIS